MILKLILTQREESNTLFLNIIFNIMFTKLYLYPLANRPYRHCLKI